MKIGGEKEWERTYEKESGKLRDGHGVARR